MVSWWVLALVAMASATTGFLLACLLAAVSQADSHLHTWEDDE